MPCINTTLITIHNASVMELVDMTDSKSVASDSVAVQVRPLVPSLLLEVDTETDESRFFCVWKKVFAT